jgi:hypothetical protein
MIAKPLKHNALGLMSNTLIIGGVLFAKTILHALKSLFAANENGESVDASNAIRTILTSFIYK